MVGDCFPGVRRLAGGCRGSSPALPSRNALLELWREQDASGETDPIPKRFLFPAPGTAPEEDLLLKSWIDGTAGNPVFTDCIPPGETN